MQIVSAGRLETQDLDLLFDSRRSLELIADDVRAEGLIGLLRRIDRSFTLSGKQDFRAVNDRGFMVDLIRPMPKPPWRTQPAMVGKQDDLKAVDIEHLDWYLSAPRMRQVVIGDDGLPAPFCVPDPRVFALHKLWLSRQEGRDPLKKPKDREQAFLVAELLSRYLPQSRFVPSELRMLPREIAQLSDELLRPIAANTDLILANDVRYSDWSYRWIKGQILSYVVGGTRKPTTIVKSVRTMMAKTPMNGALLEQILTEVNNESVRPFLRSDAHGGPQPERRDRFEALRSAFS